MLLKDDIRRTAAGFRTEEVSAERAMGRPLNSPLRPIVHSKQNMSPIGKPGSWLTRDHSEKKNRDVQRIPMRHRIYVYRRVSRLGIASTTNY